MVVLAVSTDSTVVKEIKERFPDGIYSVEDFVKKIKPGMVFFSVQGGPEAGVGGVISDTLANVEVYEGWRECFKGKMCYQVKHDSKLDLVANLLWGASACFLDQHRAEEYRKALVDHWGERVSTT